MLKLYFSLCLCLFPLWNNAQTPPYQTTHLVHYRVTYSLDTAQHGQRKNEDLYLYTSTDYSVFTNYNRLEEARQLRKLQAQYPNRTLKVNFDHRSHNLSFDKTFYKNLKTEQILTMATLGDNIYFYPEPERLVWDIEVEKRQFYGFTTQKATTHYAGRDYVAWFTTELPFQDGPYRFAGLPGLIVKLYDTNNDYHFKFESIQKTDTLTWQIKQPVTAIAKATYFKKRNAYLNALPQTASLNYILQHTPKVSGTIKQVEKDTIAHLKFNGKPITVDKLYQLFKSTFRARTNYMERPKQHIEQPINP